MQAQLIEIEVVAESVPFSFDLKHGKGKELRPAALGYVNDLKSLVFHLLDEYDR